MGFSISWVGLQLPQPRALEIMGFHETGQIDAANEAPFSIAYLPNGWSIIWSNAFDYASRPDTIRRSSAARMIGCHVEEHVMFSSCHEAGNGQMVWNVWHDSQKSIYDIHSSGAVPKEFDGIVATQKGEQDAHGGDKSSVDYLIDAPINLAASFTGYRYDRWRYNWGEPKFSVIEQAK
jgi:hypothetical protein